MKIDKFQRNAIIVCVLPIIAILVANYTQQYRVSNRNLYLIMIAIVYMLWGTSLLGGGVNSIFILDDKNQKLKKRIFWSIISLLPLIYLGIMLCTFFIIDEFNNDDIILESGERIDGYYRNS
ncbi:hypothetical protein NU10_03605 [Flavobacterium dauae]|uniref:hypothetical protein n=1 Tax=Flavobacterium dauae TaxID=1563479 RepID=UPI00101BE275|nr:hypothetical protein [Flavobacterium dauae]WLD24496.1 hypothetical protein NU10_03605 [Flavobacterium dauae]